PRSGPTLPEKLVRLSLAGPFFVGDRPPGDPDGACRMEGVLCPAEALERMVKIIEPLLAELTEPPPRCGECPPEGALTTKGPSGEASLLTPLAMSLSLGRL